MEPELLVEDWGLPGMKGSGGMMVESVDGGEGKLYIEGIFLQSNVVNGNKRIYPRPVLEKAVNKYIETQVLTKQSLGELNHPPRSNVDPLHAALIIESLEFRGDDVWGRARIIEGDHAEGDKLAALIRAGWIPGVSSRGLGTVKNQNGVNIVQEGYVLTVGVDAVWGPSAPNAYVKPIIESTETIIGKDENSPLNNIVPHDDSAFNTLIEALEKLSTH